MTSGALISVVIPTYNRAHDLERALVSIVNQTYQTWEAVIVDNHSTDDTQRVVQSLGDRRIILQNVHNHGIIAISRNAGIAGSRGDYIAFLDSDDWWTPRKLEASARALDEGADVVYHDLYLAMKPGQKFFCRKARTRPLRKPAFDDLLLNGNAVVQSSVVIRRELLLRIGGIEEDPRLVAIEDYDTWLRVSLLTERFRRLPETLGYYWAGGGNISNPARALATLDALEARHAAAFEQAGGSAGVSWLNYARGRSYYQLGKHREAREYLKRIGWNASFALNLKSRWMLSAIAARRVAVS